MNVEEREDGLLFRLRDAVVMLVRWHSPHQLRVEGWRKDKLLTPDIGNIFTHSFRKKLVEAARQQFGAKDVPNIAEDVDNVARALGHSGLQDKLKEKAGPSVAERLIHYARQASAFFHTPDRKGYASVRVNGHTENYRIKSQSFRYWLQHEFWRREKERMEDAAVEATGALSGGAGALDLPEVVREQAMGDAISQLEALALFEGPERDVHLRVAGHDGAVYVDLGDEAWRAVRVDASGWKIVDEPPVKFVRPAGMAPLPEPTRGGSADGLRGLLNIPHDRNGDRNWRLIMSWLAYAFTPGGKYPLLVIIGPQGAAKSTAERILRGILDTNAVPLRTTPRDEHNLYIDAESNWCIAFDNLSGIPLWLSDALCRLSTGGGFSTRTLFSDRDQELFEATRPVMMNGISDIANRSDLLDRAVIVNLPAIPEEERKLERAIYAELESIAPGVLGFVLDAVAEGLAGVGDVSLERLPRMADFSVWGVATEEALGGDAGGFLRAYLGSRDDATQTALDAWPVVSVLYDFASKHAPSAEKPDAAWEGTATDLWAKLNYDADDDLRRTKDWPGAPSALSAQLNRLAPSLREVGVRVERPTSSHKAGRKWRVYFEKPEPGDAGDGDAATGDGDVSDAVPPETPTGRPNTGSGDAGGAGDGDIPDPQENLEPDAWGGEV